MSENIWPDDQNQNNMARESIHQSNPKTIKIDFSEFKFPKVWAFLMEFLFLEKYYIFEFARWIHFLVQVVWFIAIYNWYAQQYSWEIPWIIVAVIYYIAVRFFFELFLIWFSINDKLTRICDVIESSNNEDIKNKIENKYIKSISIKV